MLMDLHGGNCGRESGMQLFNERDSLLHSIRTECNPRRVHPPCPAESGDESPHSKKNPADTFASAESLLVFAIELIAPAR
jgi:hypothetical protein